jgi:hypothetical protein
MTISYQIHVSSLHYRGGLFTVAALKFAYNTELIALLKQAIRETEGVLGEHDLGGWLKEHWCWFVEWQALPLVKRKLAGRGVDFCGPEAEN